MKRFVPVVLTLCLLVVSRIGATQTQGHPTVSYFGHQRCGVVDPTLLPPQTRISFDMDGDGRIEHLIANGAVIELHRIQPGSNPPVLIREAILYSSHHPTPYICVDLALHDYDEDGELELIYGTPDELMIFEIVGQRLRDVFLENQSFLPTADVKFHFNGIRPVLRAR